jgi:hypothetical protein
MMTDQSRQTKVLVALLVSIVLCTIILNVLGHNPPSAGAFCLSQYNRLEPIDKLIRSADFRRPGYWKWIEIYYSEGDSLDRVVSASNIQVERLLSSVSGWEDIDCHFIICNGRDDLNGEIRPTEKWKRQLPVKHQPDDNVRRAWQNEQTIFICILTSGLNAQPTNFQIKRLYVLVEDLCRELKINSESVIYPNSWQY